MKIKEYTFGQRKRYVVSFRKENWCSEWGTKGLVKRGMRTDFISASSMDELLRKAKEKEQHPYFIEWL